MRKNRLLVWADDGGRIPAPSWQAWTLPDGRIIRGDNRDDFSSASLSPDGAEVLFTGVGGLRVVNLLTGARRSGPGDVVFARASPSGIVVGATNGGRINFYDPVTFAPDGPSLRGTPEGVDQFAFSGDGRTMVIRGTSGWVSLVDTAARTQLGGRFPAVEGHQPVALRPDGEEVAVPGAAGVLVWSLGAPGLVEAACRYAGRNLTEAEAQAHLLEAHRTCSAP